ncbi:MAG: chromate resistance protein [Myxococcales bacterium]|nr:chromate resistance protein [Myxococcales bacterium]
MSDAARWLLLIHQIPPKPNYFRVKVWRRLQRIGAVALKNSVYVLPKSDAAQEDLAWVLREILAGGADATLCEARMVDGITDDQIESLFNAARDADYAQITEELRRLLGEPHATEEARAGLRTEFERVQRRFGDLTAIDFFGAPGRVAVDGLLGSMEARLRPAEPVPTSDTTDDPRLLFQGRVWVTRKGVHVDRIACAWLIRRFIDDTPKFKFVPGKDYQPQPSEVRFDMFEAEFTHEGELCSFEVFLKRLHIDDPALHAIAEIIHDIDLKDSKFARAETAGVASLILGIAQLHREDEARIAQGSALFDALYEFFAKRKR